MTPRSLLPLALTCLLSAQDNQIVFASLERLRKGDAAGAVDLEAGSVVERLILKPEMLRASWVVRLQGAEWLMRAYSLRQSIRRPGEGGLAAQTAAPELLRAWTFVSTAETDANRAYSTQAASSQRGSISRSSVAYATTPTEASQTVRVREAAGKALDWIRLELAVLLQDPSRMKTALVHLESRTDLNTREKVFALRAAAHLGRWDLFQAWGAELGADTDQPSRLRARAERDWTQPDYLGLLKQARERALKPETAPLTTAEWPVRGMAIRLKQLRTDDPGLDDRMQAGSAWTESGPVEVPLVRIGAVVHWLKPGTNPVPLVGTVGTEGLVLEGSTEFSSAGGTIWKQERYRLAADAAVKGRWNGTLEVVQQAVEGAVAPAQVFRLTFEVRLDLGENLIKPMP